MASEARPAPQRALAGVRDVARAIPVWGWLTGLVLVSTAARYATARWAVAPWIMVDEIIYSELAKSFASSGQFLVRDQPTAAYGVVYPALISPAWAMFKSIPDAYAAAKIINCVVMSLAAIPGYFLARRLLGPGLSLLAAALAVSIPSMLYTGTLMTENAFYPIFIAAAITLVVWLERPTLTTTAVVLAVFALAYLTRAQALALGPAILTAPLIFAWAQRRNWRSLAEYKLMYGIVAVGGVLVVLVQVARGRAPLGVLGAYQVAGESNYKFWQVFKWFWYHLGELDLALGVIPFAALIVLATVMRGLDRRAQAFVAVSLAVTFWLTLEVATFASVLQLRVEERNLFYVMPLFLIALLVWIDRGLPRPGRAAAAVAIVAAALPGVLPYEHLIGLTAVSDTIALLPLWALHSGLFPIEQVALVVVLGCIAAAMAFLFVPQRYALVLPLLVIAYFAVSQKPIEDKFQTFSIGALFSGITKPHPDWIDRKLGRDADVSMIWSGNTDPRVVWESEFFNRSVGTIYEYRHSLTGGLPAKRIKIDVQTGRLLADGKPIESRYVLTDNSFGLAGKPIAADPARAMFLYKTSGPLRQTSQVTGLYPNDTWSGRTVIYRRVNCSGGSLAITLRSDASLKTGPQTVTASELGHEVARVTLRPGATRKLDIPLSEKGDVCAVVFTITPTAIPAVVTHGVNPDARVLGVHFNRFDYHP